MNRALSSCVLVICTAASSGCFSSIAGKPPEVTGKATGDLAPGSRVGARDGDGNLVLAEVVKSDAESYFVKFSTGKSAAVKKADIVPIAAPGSLKTGDRVLAPTQEVWLRQADVVRTEGAFVIVVFSGHTDETKVPQDRVAHLPEGLCDAKLGCTGSGKEQKDTGGGKGVVVAETDPWKALSSSLKIGDQVIVQWAEIGSSMHFDWRVGTISGRNGDALVVKVPGEATPKNGFPKDLRPLRAPKRGITTGGNLLWSEQPGRYLQVWIASGPDDEGKYSIAVKRGKSGEGFVQMTKEQLSALAPFDPEDF